jgi:hypothetical protein
MTRAADATKVVVERFRIHGSPSCSSLPFEQSDDLARAVPFVDTGRPSLAEGQVFIRVNVDEADSTIVYADSPCGPTQDLALLDAAPAALGYVGDELARMQAAGR